MTAVNPVYRGRVFIDPGPPVRRPRAVGFRKPTAIDEGLSLDVLITAQTSFWQGKPDRVMRFALIATVAAKKLRREREERQRVRQD